MPIHSDRYNDSTEARKELFEFYSRVYPGAEWLLDPQRFHWQTITNPFVESGQTEIWLLRDGTKDIIGQNIYIPYPFSIGGRQHTGFCSTNLIVRPGLVGKGIGHRLIEINESRPGVPYAVGITKASERAFIKRGWVLVEDARLYTRVIKPRKYSAFLNLPGLKGKLAPAALYAAKLLGSITAMLGRKQNFPNLEIEKITRFEAAHDSLWNSFLNGFAIHFERRADLLNYKYFGRTDVSHNVVLFKRNGQPVGYGVYRLSKHPASELLLGRLVDMVFDPQGGQPLIRDMIRYLTDKLLADNVDGLVCMAPTPEVAGALKKNGFLLSRPQHAIMFERDFSIDNLRRQFPYLWYITLGDSDLDNYW